MIRTAYVIGRIEYDDEQTTLEDIEAAIGRERWPLGLRASGVPGLREMSLATSDGVDFDHTFEMRDAAHARDAAGPLRLRVAASPPMISIVAVGDHDQELAEVALDYFNNRLQALVYRPGREAPDPVVVLVEDVDRARAVTNQGPAEET